VIEQTPSAPAPSPGFNRTLGVSLAILLTLAVLRVAMGWLVVPLDLVAPLSNLISILFVAGPIFALYSAARFPWKPLTALLLLVLGLSVWGGGYVLAGKIHQPILSTSLFALSQSGVIMWCFAVGSLLAMILKDKNLLLPMAIFLALFDMWLVFAPEGFVQHSIVADSGKALAIMGYHVPALPSAPAGGRAADLLYVGPADYLFISMFFAALFRFKMRTRATLYAIVPVLAAYLLVALIFTDVQIWRIRLGALPALLPIGMTVLIMNRKEFNLNRDERITTIFIAVVGTIVAAWRISLPGPPPVIEHIGPPQPDQPSNSAPGRGPQTPPGQTWIAAPDRSPWAPRIAPGNTRDLL